jgi:hypothetical protein
MLAWPFEKPLAESNATAERNGSLDTSFQPRFFRDFEKL